MASSKTADEGISLQIMQQTDTVLVESDETQNPNDVFWDGNDDRSNPKNWTVVYRWSHIVIISLVTFVTYVPDPIVFLCLSPPYIRAQIDSRILGHLVHRC